MNEVFSGGIYQPLTRENVIKIHEAALTILERTGVGFEPGLADMARMLDKAGATVDFSEMRIRFPRDMVCEQTDLAPDKVVLYGRSPEHDLVLSDHRVHMGTGGAAVRVLDLDTGRARPSTLRDLYDIGRLVDRLDNIMFFLRPCIPTDIDPLDYDANVFYTCFRATQKHVMAGVNDADALKAIVEMAAMVANGNVRLKNKPFFSIIASFSISPLKLSAPTLRIATQAAKQRIPVALSCAPMAGSTSPITMAGTLAQIHAEQLAGIVICQLTNPGAPVIYGGIPGLAELRTMGYEGGAVECGMMNAAIHQMAGHIRVPNYNSSGLSDAKVPDAQAGWEKALTTVLAAMGGSNYIHHAAGMLESMLTVSYEQYVMDDEVIGNCRRVLRGIEVDDDHLALDVIHQVGPGGNFIAEEHTMDHLRTEYFQGNGVTDRQDRDTWTTMGQKDARTRAREIAKEILAKPDWSHISKEADRHIRQRFNILLQTA